MNEALRIVLTGLIVLLIQVGTGPLLEVFHVRPDLILIYCLLVTLRHGRIAGLATGFLLGLALDFLSLGYLGVYALCKSSLSFWTGVCLDNRVGSVALGWWLFILAVASVLQGLAVGILAPQGLDPVLGAFILQIVLPGTLYTSIAGLLWAVAPMGARSRGPLAPAATRGRRSLR